MPSTHNSTNIKYRVMVADDHKLFRDGLAATLRMIKSVAYVTQAADGTEVMNLLKDQDTPLNIIFMDINMPVKNGIATTKEVKRFYPKIKVIALTMHDDQKHVVDMFAAGACGYLLKNTDKTEITEAIDTVMSGGQYYSKEISSSFLLQALDKNSLKANAGTSAQLFPKEIEVLELIYKELSTREIAARLNISPRTVEAHRQSLFQKTRTQTIAGLIKYAIKNGFANE